MKIIFVCLGNICRSPMAEFVMKDLLVRQKKSDQFIIESRATSNWEHGNPVHQGTLKILRKYNITVDETKRSQQITVDDFVKADKIIAMDSSNLTDLSNLAPENMQQKITMLLEQSVPDPWYTNDFEQTYQLVKAGCERLLSEISEQ